MSAPTALLKPTAAPEDVSCPVGENDEPLFEATNSATMDTEVLVPAQAEDTEMTTIDEENRPKFAPGLDVVWQKPHGDFLETYMLTLWFTGRSASREQKDSNSASPRLELRKRTTREHF